MGDILNFKGQKLDNEEFEQVECIDCGDTLFSLVTCPEHDLLLTVCQHCGYVMAGSKLIADVE